MAKPRRGRAREAQLAFDAISIEGGLLSPEWLSKVSQLQAGSQGETDYRVPKGLNLRDEIGRFWRIAQAHWSDYAAGVTAKADGRTLAIRLVCGLLRDCFGFASLTETEPQKVGDRMYPIGHAALAGRVPVVIAQAEQGLDIVSPTFVDGNRRRSAFGLAQEYLNAQEGALWGIASDGATLRIVRDNASLTRPAWIEADLRRVFTEERYSDFAALWLLAHESRFGTASQPAEQCPMETWREAGREQGTRARDQLRQGVEEALAALGQGFLAHPENKELRAQLQDGSLTSREYFSQLLRLVYRLIFLLTVEERGVLHPPATAATATSLYASGYSLKRLAERSVKRSAHDRFSDLWEAVKVVLCCLQSGEPKLGVPALAGIFAAHNCAALDSSRLQNRFLLLATFKLAWLRDDAGLARVNWRDMGPEELGSVYESLMELMPRVSQDCREFGFATGDEVKGNARKTTGSYYTPDSLVQALLDSALDPVIAETLAKNPERQVDALLELSIVDPACGSGHFLLAAARRLAAQVARLRANGTPSPPEYRRALREVASRCLYGVDLNPMAVELCKVSLWMEAVVPGQPLTFLDSHIQCGNALLGTTPDLMASGIPDAAWEPIEGDDRKTASALKKRNKKEQDARQPSLPLRDASDTEANQVGSEVARLDAEPDADARALAAKEVRWQSILQSSTYRHQKFVADAWCAAFVWPKQPGALADSAPTNELWRQLRDGRGNPPTLTAKAVNELAEQYGFLHWQLQFAQVFAKGGFDVVLGNPPWEHVELKEEEWFAERRPDIAGALNAATRKKIIATLEGSDPRLWREFVAAKRRFEGETHLMRSSGRYAFCGRGRINTYAVFSEHNRSVLGPRGRAGFIVLAGIVTDDTTKEFFADLVARRHLVAVYHFENEDRIFPEVHHATRFVLLTLGEAPQADLVFFARQVSDFADKQRHFSLSSSEFAALNPNTRTCPTFRSRRDAEINLAVYRRVGVLWREDDEHGNPWGLRFMQGVFNMASDSDLFRTRAELKPNVEYLPLFEAKMVHHFDHRFGTYEGQTVAQEKQGKLPELDDAAHADPKRGTQPYYWVEAHEVASRLPAAWDRRWLLGWRDFTGTEKQRTLISSLIPRVGTGDTFLLALTGVESSLLASLYANLCSFALDYCARQKVGGTHLKYYLFKQLPVLGPKTYEVAAPWSPRAPLRDWLLPRVVELTYTSWDLELFARDVEYDGPPYRWDPKRRFLLRCELDAAFFHLYGLSRDDAAYVMDTFPIVRKNDEKAHYEYRTKRVILEIYDAMAEASRTGREYATRLDPPPADPRVAHQDTRSPRGHGRPAPETRGAR